MVTAYDFTMARLVDEAGVDMVLVGDSLGMVVQGLTTTIPVTLDEMAYHCRAVARGLGRAHLVGDLPFMSYQVSPQQAVESAGKLMKEGACESVKLEGGQEVAEHVHRIVRAGVPVVGHVGLTPQSVHALGGFKVQGRGADGAEKVLADAVALEQAGAFAIVLEAIPPDLAAQVTALVSIPTIGIGAGAGCDGQVLVCTDLLGLVARSSAEVRQALRQPRRRRGRGVQRVRERGPRGHVPGRGPDLQAERGERGGRGQLTGRYRSSAIAHARRRCRPTSSMHRSRSISGTDLGALRP